MASSDCIVTINYSVSNGTNILKDFPGAVSWSLKGSTPPMSDNQQKASAAIRDLNDKEREAISSEIKAIEVKNKEHIVTGLKAVADLETLKKQSARRFVLVYWKDNEHHVVQGIDFAYSQAIDKDDETDERRVFLYELAHDSVGYEHYTMDRLHKRLDSQGVPYHIAYLNS